MISDMYDLRPIFSSSVSPSNSTNSFDLVAVLDPDECQLLSASISMESLWSIDSDDTVPQFPDRPAATITPILLDDRSMLHPRGRGKTEPDDYGILTTIATTPRMKNLLLETLRVDLWVDTTIIRVAPPGHIPWESPIHVPACTWVPSGSLFPPSMFRQALRSSRNVTKGRSAVLATFGSVEPRTSKQRSSSQQRRSRKALVFQHEINLSTGGTEQRCSLEVPAATMNPEMVDMMLELQDLNTFFRDSLQDLEESVAVLAEEKDKLGVAFLVPSDSPRALSHSAETPARPQRDPSIPLAARRGKTLLPPLSLTGKNVENSYPSIPTVFLGSPTAYSPKSEYANAQGDPSLDLEDMITNLRSQCDWAQRGSHEDSEIVVESPVSVPPDDENLDDDGDDWAFAKSLLDEYGSQSGHKNFEMKSETAEKNLGVGDPSLSNGPSTPRAQTPVSVPPSVPLPATPASRGAPASHPASPSGVRGILKTSKNVRFASLPQPEKPEDRNVDTAPSPITTPPAAPPATVPPERPSRIRSYSRPSKQLKENAPILVTPRPHRPQSAYVVPAAKTEKTLPLYIAPSPTGDPLQSKKAVYPGQNQSPQNLPPSNQPPQRPSARRSSAPARRSAPVSLGRQSLNSPVKAGLQQQVNETKGGTFPRHKAGSRWTMNDMTLRRGSNADQQTPEAAPKSRMPVPLRNILTRFK
ncbi:hypothetical protein LshimejAT787_1004210 [Lyophyllum shimeji]|uniref:Uncharacterized protein n=1 Tax=Lyophyllum shimeji TaxID=47721 RepID=A0A9P3PV55_LYOSH|nr:hypothetical protein LshimejAT787_1004210 [Lyophyllum shimeji]